MWLKITAAEIIHNKFRHLEKSEGTAYNLPFYAEKAKTTGK